MIGSITRDQFALGEYSYDSAQRPSPVNDAVMTPKRIAIFLAIDLALMAILLIVVREIKSTAYPPVTSAPISGTR
jgi:hypothetical protein